MKKKRINGIIGFIVSVLVTVIFVIPLLWMVSSSLKSNGTIFKVPPDLIPRPALWSNYPETVNYIPFFRYLKNTIIITALSTIGALLSTPPVAYGFAKLKWPGRQFAFFVVLSTMMLPYQVEVIPLYILYRKIGWLNTFLPLIVPNFFSGAMYIFLMRQFMLGIPNELSDAALVDGANHFQIMTKIMVPLCKPVMAAVALFSIMGNWTDFFAPLVFLTSESKYTLSLGLQMFSSRYQTQWNYLMAACTMFTIPPLILFFFTQSYFLIGISFTGVKE